MWVVCNDKLRKIENIQCGMQVLTFENGYKKVIDVYTYTSNKKTIEFITKRGFSINVSEDQQILVYNKTHKFVKAQDVLMEDKLIIKPHHVSRGLSSMMFSSSSSNVPLVTEFEGITEIDCDVATVYGAFWVGDLKFKGNLKWFEMINNDKTIPKILLSRFNIDPKITKYTTYVDDERFVRFLQSLTFELVLQSPSQIQKAFIRGMRCTAHISKNTFSFHSIDINRLQQFQLLLLNCGYPSTIYLFNSNYILKYYSIIQSKPIHDTIISKQVLSTNTTSTKIIIEDGHTFVANGIIIK